MSQPAKAARQSTKRRTATFTSTPPFKRKYLIEYTKHISFQFFLSFLKKQKGSSTTQSTVYYSRFHTFISRHESQFSSFTEQLHTFRPLFRLWIYRTTLGCKWKHCTSGDTSLRPLPNEWETDKLLLKNGSGCDVAIPRKHHYTCIV
jgi:hypothetical protein